MRILFLHQNFPGQFRQLIPRLLQQGHELRAICSHDRPVDEAVKIARYKTPEVEASLSSVPGVGFWSEGMRRALLVCEIANEWEKEGWCPDLMLGHSGWGETLLLDSVWPNVPQVIWPELWVRPHHAGIIAPPVGTGPTPFQRLEHLGRNQLTRAALQNARAWVLPTEHQANSFPSEFLNDQLHVIHEGIDVNVACPNAAASYNVGGVHVNQNVPTITFINRNLERLRGFDIFMRSLPYIFKMHPSVRVVIVGDNGTGYGGGVQNESSLSLKEQMLIDIGANLDLERIHFLGRVPYSALIAILQASWVHVYLSKPFILSWSLLEAMACGCCIVGSDGMPVSEVIHSGSNGITIPMDNYKKLSTCVVDLLSNSSMREQLGSQARKDSLKWDQNVVWPKFEFLFESLLLRK